MTSPSDVMRMVLSVGCDFDQFTGRPIPTPEQLSRLITLARNEAYENACDEICLTIGMCGDGVLGQKLLDKVRALKSPE